MDLITALVSPISGALIGYFTNWLAIKMLFRPHEEKRLFNRKLPFTPGLIPRERYQLSAKIGETIGEHLITAEVLTTEITSDEVTERIKGILETFFDNLIAKNLTVHDAVNILAGDDVGAAVDKGTEYICGMASGYLRNESVAAFISDTAIEKLIDLLKDEEIFKKAMGLLESVRQIVTEKGVDFFEGEEFRVFVGKAAGGVYKYSDKTLDELIPESVVEVIKNAVKDNLPNIVEVIKRLPEDYPALDENLSKTVQKIIEDNFGKLIGIFINHDKVYGNIKDGIFEYLDDDVNREIIYLKLEESMTKLLTMELGQLLDRIPDKAEIEDKIIKLLAENALSEKLIGNMMDFAVSKLNELDGYVLYDAIEKIMPGFEQEARVFMFEKISVYLSDNSDTLLLPMIHRIKTWILEASVNNLILQIGSGSVENTKTLALELIKTALEKCSGYVAESLNVPKMVEDKMNAFDVAEAENIILSVVSKQLKAITAVGGILGFILGLLPLIFFTQ